MDSLLKNSSRVFSENHRINLYYINELYQNIGEEVANRLKDAYGIDLVMTSGIWGGTYLIAKPNGLSRRRIWRLYSIVNLPQNSPLDIHENFEKLVAIYADVYKEAFAVCDLELELKMWGGKLPHSNIAKPSITMHMEDKKERIRWLRTFFIWNRASWEESIISDTVRIIKEYKPFFDLKKGPIKKNPKDTKYLLQDIIIIYRTLENACSNDFKEHASPIIQTMMQAFMEGLDEPEKINELYLMVFNNALIYGFEESLEQPFKNEGLDIHTIENWPVERINWIPEELKEKLIPPIQNIFSGFKTELESNMDSIS